MFGLNIELHLWQVGIFLLTPFIRSKTGNIYDSNIELHFLHYQSKRLPFAYVSLEVSNAALSYKLSMPSW